MPCGTTGESPTLTREEHLRVVEITVEEAKGTGSGAGRRGRLQHRRSDRTRRRNAKRLGADGILSVTPYYNKPTQEGLYQHYKAIADAVPLPIIVYSVQGRTGVNVEPATLKRLAEIDNIVGVKEASGNIQQMAQRGASSAGSVSSCSRGDDAITIPLIALGGRGVISVVSNEIPRRDDGAGAARADAAISRARASCSASICR